jgi:hypothetical protein
MLKTALQWLASLILYAIVLPILVVMALSLPIEWAYRRVRKWKEKKLSASL